MLLSALIYNGFNSTLDSYRGGKHDIYGSMFAGACTGALWKCTGESNVLVPLGEGWRSEFARRWGKAVASASAGWWCATHRSVHLKT